MKADKQMIDELISAEDRAAIEDLNNHRRPLPGYGPGGSVSIGPIGIEPGDDGWQPLGYLAEDGITFGPIEETEDGNGYRTTIHHQIPAGRYRLLDNRPSHHTTTDPDVDRREQIRDWMRKHLGIQLDPFQERILNGLWPYRALEVHGHDEAGYIKYRLNQRLQGHNPGPYEKDPMKR